MPIESIPSLCVVVSSCDAYKDLWPIFAFYYEKSRLTVFPAVIISDKEASSPSSHISVIAPPFPKEFGDRMVHGMQGIVSDYILFLLDDFLLTEPVDLHLLSKIMLAMHSHNFDFLRLSKGPHLSLEGRYSIGIRDLNLEKPYDADVHPFIIKTELFKTIMKKAKGETIWQFEVNFAKRLDAVNAKCGYYPKPFFHYKEAVTKGKFFRSCYYLVKKSHLYFGSRRKISIWFSIIYNFRLWCHYLIPIRLQKALKGVQRKRGKKFLSDLGEFK
jgi:hypothetical protein